MQHLLKHIDHRLLARGDGQCLHVQRRGVERHEETRAAHAAQLVEHQRPVGHRQRAEVTDAGTHGMRQAAGAGTQPLKLAGAQLRYPDNAGQPWASRTTSKVSSSIRPSKERGSRRQRRSGRTADMCRQQVATAAHRADQPGGLSVSRRRWRRRLTAMSTIRSNGIGSRPRVALPMVSRSRICCG